MENDNNTYFYLKHPDHIKMFFQWFARSPSTPNIPEINFNFPSGNFIANSIWYSVLGLIIMLIDGFSKTYVIVGLTPIFILILAYVFCFLNGIRNYILNKFRYKKALEIFPKNQSYCINRLPDDFVKYYKYIASKVKYRYNYKTKVGSTASLLRSSLKKLNIDVKQEAELLWKGLYLFPQRPEWRVRKNDGWYKQFKYTADFIYVDKEKGIMLDIEIDEKHHFEDSKQIEKDTQRNNIFLCSGWSIIRFKDSEIRNNSQKCAEDIKKVILQIELAYSIIYEQLKRLQDIDLTSNDYAMDKLSNWLSRRVKVKAKEYFRNVDYEYDFSVNYSYYQLEKYLFDYYSLNP